MTVNEYLINLLSTYLNNENPKKPCDVDLEKLFDLAKINAVSGIVYTQLQKNDGDITAEPHYINMQNLFYTDMMYYSRRCVTKNILEKVFKNEKIRFAYVKGSVLCNYYRDPELRTMGDLDILIDEANREKVHNILLQSGAEYDRESSHSDETSYMLNKTVVEVHTKLIYDNVSINGVNYEQYFSDEINNLIMSDEYCGTLRPERHFLYLLAHMAKHFYNNGCGVRMFMDLHIIKNYYGDNLDAQYIARELSKLKLDKFADCIFQLCNFWFGSGFDCKNTLSDEQLRAVEQFVLEAGTFGKTGRNNEAIKIHRIGFIRHIFPSYSTMRQYSTWFADKPAFLLPVAYIERGIHNLKERGGPVRWIKKIRGGSKEVTYHNNITDIMGLHI